MSAPDFPVDATVALLDDESRTASRSTKQRSTLLTVCPFILGNEFCERLAFYGYAAGESFLIADFAGKVLKQQCRHWLAITTAPRQYAHLILQHKRTLASYANVDGEGRYALFQWSC